MTTILVVEDDPGIRRALRSILRSRDFEVLEAATGEAALAAAADRGPDLIVLDLGLPTSVASRCSPGCATSATFRWSC